MLIFHDQKIAAFVSSYVKCHQAGTLSIRWMSIITLINFKKRCCLT